MFYKYSYVSNSRNNEKYSGSYSIYRASVNGKIKNYNVPLNSNYISRIYDKKLFNKYFILKFEINIIFTFI